MTLHSTHSLSSSSRWIEGRCPASIAMIKPYTSTGPIDDDYEDNYAAKEGTAAHELREFCLRLGVQPQQCIGLTFNDVKVDQDMIDGVTIDINYVKRLEVEYGVKPLIEVRVVMSSLGREDVFGTCDTLFVVPKKRLIHPIDFKYGRLPVEVENNSQLTGYGVSALDTFGVWDGIDTMVTSITQPRYSHRDGPIRTVEYDITEVDEIADMFYRSVLLTEDLSQKPHAGPWCRYCPASGNCRARLMKTIETLYRDRPLENISSEELELLIAEASVAKSHLESIHDEARRRASRGHRFENYKLVESRPRMKCTDEKRLVAEAVNSGVNKDRLFENKLKSKSVIEKIIPQKLVEKYYVRPQGHDILVPMSDKRIAKVVGHVPKGTFGKVSK